MKKPRSAGGWKAIGYSLRLANRVGWRPMWQAMRSRNSCKTCALGMGGQLGGMVNEGGHFPEVCKKSFQAMASDMQPALPIDFFKQNSIDDLRKMSSKQLEASGRLTQPLLLEPQMNHFRPIDWEHALDRIASGLKEAGADRSFFYASGRSSNEAGFVLQMMARLFGTNYVNNCSYYCHQASGVGLGSAIGTGAGTITLEDLDHTDLYILIGANPASNHPRLMRSLMQIRRRGGRVIVINPVRELGLERFKVPSDLRSLLFGSRIASLYVQPHIGGDLALLTGIVREVLEQNSHDSGFIAKHTEGFEDFAVQAHAFDWDQIERDSGVDRATIQEIASQYIDAKNVVIGWCMGITHHLHGTQNVQMIANLALLRGMVGRQYAGLMPIRGHSNVQGMGTVGVTPALKREMLERFEQRMDIRVPESPGYDTMACMNAAHRGEMDAALCLGGNLYASNPDSRRALDALNRINSMTYLSTTLNSGHAWATGRDTVILPVLPRDEESQPTSQESMFSFVRLSSGGAARLRGPRSEVSILCDIAERLIPEHPRVDWSQLRSHSAIRELISELVPGYESVANLDRGGEEFHVPGRAVRDYHFPTVSGRARFHALELPVQDCPEGHLRMMTVRSEGQFNSVVYDEEDLYRGQDRRDVILVNPDDMLAMGLVADQPVIVRSATAEIRRILVRPFRIRAGNALMYYPEGNALVDHAVDPDSKTPAFKSVLVQLQPENGST